MLSKRQAELLQFLETSIRLDGTCPSHQEICEALGLGSKSQVHRLVGILEEKGFLKRLPGRSRSIEVIRAHAAAPIPVGYTEVQVSRVASALVCSLGAGGLPEGQTADGLARRLLDAAFSEAGTPGGIPPMTRRAPMESLAVA